MKLGIGNGDWEIAELLTSNLLEPISLPVFFKIMATW